MLKKSNLSICNKNYSVSDLFSSLNDLFLRSSRLCMRKSLSEKNDVTLSRDEKKLKLHKTEHTPHHFNSAMIK